MERESVQPERSPHRGASPGHRLAFGLSAGALLVLAFGVFGGLADAAGLWVVDLTEVGCAAAGAVGCALGARRAVGRSQRAWLLLAVGCGCWCLGQGYWSFAELVLGEEAPFPSLADAGYLCFPPAAAAGLWLLPVRSTRGQARRLLDAVLVACAVSLLFWQTALGAVFAAGGESLLGTVVSLAYPVGDVVLLTMTVLALAQGSRQRRALALVAAGLCAIALADAMFAYQSAAGAYASAGVTEFGWCSGFLLLGIAGTYALPGRQAEDAAATVVSASILPYVPIAVAAPVVAVRYLVGHEIDAVTLVLATMMMTLVLARQYATVRDNQDLAQTVADRESELSHQAFHDALTGLANRALFGDRVVHALERRHRGTAGLAVAFLDLDGFKGVNDSLGHAAGDELLMRAAERLRGALRSGDTLARLGGDEFAVLMEDCEQPEVVASHLVEAFRPPFTLSGRPVGISVSVGVAAVEALGAPVEADVLLRRADVAMYAVKRSGKNDFRMHTPGLRLDEADDVSLHTDLEKALRERAIVPAYQPVVDVATGAILGFEALARWERDGEQVPPTVFVPVAERGGLAPALTDLMLDTVCAQVAQWQRAGLGEDMYVAVNVSRHELSHTRLPLRVADALARYGLAGGRLLVEVTESGLTEDPEAARRTLCALREQGVRVALDDFGTGYNGLAQLLQIPLDVVKIDRLFVQDIDTDRQRQRVLEGLVGLADRLRLQVIAEGVERQDQLDQLARLGVTVAQGYLLGMPASAGATAVVLRRELATR